VGKRPEGDSLRVDGFPKVRKAIQESTGPFDIPCPQRVCKVAKLNLQESAHFAQVLDGPSCGRCAMLPIEGIHICAVLNQEPSDSPMPGKRSEVKGRCTQFVPLMNEFRMVFNHGFHFFQ
jgi:hypothetical protein